MLLGLVNAIEDYGMQSFWDDDSGGCPCFLGSKSEDGHTVNVMGRCWRVSDSEGFQDLYVWGDHPDLKTIGESVKRALDAQDWYQPYLIIWEKPDEWEEFAANKDENREAAETYRKSREL